jgi:hypothetical protein
MFIRHIRKIVLGTAVLAFVGCAGTASLKQTEIPKDAVTFLGAAVIPGGAGATVDRSGLPHLLLEDGQSYNDAFDGFGSAIAYTGYGNRYLLLADRGPNKVQYQGGKEVDYTTSYFTRFQIADIVVKQKGEGWDVSVSLVGTSLLRDEAGRNFIGISTAYREANPEKNLRMDPEGIRVAPDGTVWISDEYGPVVYHFDQSGKRIGTLKLPEAFLIDKPASFLSEEMAQNKKGRYTNRGAEGLALSPDGKIMVVALQSALVQDGGLSGLGTRFLVYDMTDTVKEPKQFVYLLDSTKMVVSEVLAVNDHLILVDERDSTGGPQGVKRLYLIDLEQHPPPSDVSKVSALPKNGVPENITPLNKRLFADIGALLNAAAPYTTPAGLPDKIEGYAFGPDLPDGRRLLLATNDNDYAETYPNYIFAFAVDPRALPGFQAVNLKPGVRFAP